MLHNRKMLCNMVKNMSIGNSGRIVIEIEPQLKQELHTVLRIEGTNLKTWFLSQVEDLLAEKGQKSLPLESSRQVKEVVNEIQT